MDEPGSPGEDPIPWPVRCRVKGTYTYRTLDSEAEVDVQSLVVEGFDPETGETTWTFDASPKLLTDDERPPLAGEHQLVVLGRGGKPRVLDLDDGSTRAPKRGEVLWCRTRAEFGLDQAWESEGQQLHDRSGGDLAHPCRADGSAVRRDPGSLPELLATRVQQVGVVSQPRGVVGYRLVTG